MAERKGERSTMSHRVKRGAGLALAVLMLLLVPTACSDARERGDRMAAGEVSLPEELLHEKYLEGRTAEARAGFSELLAQRVDRLDRLGATRPSSLPALAEYAIALDELIRGLYLQQCGELGIRGDAQLTTADVALQVVDCHQSIREHAAALAAQPTTRALSPADDDWRVQDILAVQERAAEALFRTLLFLRGTPLEDRRQELLDEVRTQLDLPPSIEALDAQHPDLSSVFGLEPVGDPESPPGQEGAGELDEEQRRLVESFLRDLFSTAAVGALRVYFVAGYWPEERLYETRAECPGCSLASVGRIQASGRQPDGTLAVSVDRLTIITAQGDAMETRLDLHIGRGRSGLGIVRLGSEDIRRADGGRGPA